MSAINVPVEYHVCELVGVPKAFSVAVDEVIHCMEQVEIEETTPGAHPTEGDEGSKELGCLA
jgi:hypothetical protein